MTTSSTTPTTFTTGHVGLNVSDVERSADFYRRIFDWEVTATGEEPGRQFAFLSDEGRIVVTLWQQSSGQFAKDRPGLHHLSFQVDSIEDVLGVEARVREAGVSLHHDGIVPHGEGASSGGIFFDDPDGIRLEVYAPSGADAHQAAPSGAAPTCGFF